MPGRWTVESVFGLRKLNERFRVKNKYVLFFDLEKIFDQVPREVICSALRWKSAPFGELWSRFSLKVCPSRVCFETTFIYYGNGCSDRRFEGLFVNGVVVCRGSYFVLGIIMRLRASMGDGKMQWKESVQRWMSVKQNACSYYLGKKYCFESGSLWCLRWVDWL